MSLREPTELLASLKDRLSLGLALGVGLALRLVNLTKSSIWHDEGYSLMLVAQSPGQIIARTARDVHPPLYYLLLHYWTWLFGNSEAAARSLSVIFGLVTIVATFFLLRRLFGRQAARWGVWLLAIGPFAIRFSQEARMYGLVAMLAALGTLALVRYQQDRRKLDLVWYVLAMAAALYTQYYAIFIVLVHWVYMAGVSLWPQRQWRRGLLDGRWWLANLAIAASFAPWLPVLYSQVTRIQGGFWIGEVGWTTLPNTLSQFVTFTDWGQTPLGLRVGVLIGLMLLVQFFVIKQPRQRASWLLLAAYLGLGPLLIFGLSFKRPIYVDRYFVFSATALYALLGVLICQLTKPWRWLVGGVLTAALAFGVVNVYRQSDHGMRLTATYVSQHYQTGDALVSGELYTFFDFSYYNQTGAPLRLWLPGDFPGCCEGRSLLNDQPDIPVKNLADLKPPSGLVWMIGKTGPHDYFDNLPTNWHPSGPRFVAGYTAVQPFRVSDTMSR